MPNDPYTDLHPMPDMVNTRTPVSTLFFSPFLLQMVQCRRSDPSRRRRIRRDRISVLPRKGIAGIRALQSTTTTTTQNAGTTQIPGTDQTTVAAAAADTRQQTATAARDSAMMDDR
jgi:hypothetical protein